MKSQFIENIGERLIPVEMSTCEGGPTYSFTYVSQTFAGVCMDIICQSQKDSPTFFTEKARLHQGIRNGQSHLTAIKQMLDQGILSLSNIPKIINDYEVVQIITQFHEPLDDQDEQIFETIFPLLIKTDNYITLAGGLNYVGKEGAPTEDKFIPCAKQIAERVLETLHTHPKDEVRRRLGLLSYICDHTEDRALHVLIKQELHENHATPKKPILTEKEIRDLEGGMTEEELTATPGKTKRREDN